MAELTLSPKGYCTIAGCDKIHYARGWCTMHYARWLRTGDPTICRKASPGIPYKFLMEKVFTYDGDECLKWPYAHTAGRGVLWLDGKRCLVPRLACESIHGPPPTPKHEEAHECGKGHEGCCTPKHLTWKTSSENEADKIRHGTSPRGEKCGTAKLKAPQVAEIRLLLLGAVKQREIAEQYGVSQALISRIKIGKAWGWQTTPSG